MFYHLLATLPPTDSELTNGQNCQLCFVSMEEDNANGSLRSGLIIFGLFSHKNPGPFLSVYQKYHLNNNYIKL